MSCPDCGASLDATPVAARCPQCGGLRRDARVTPLPATATVTVPPPRIITDSAFADGSREQTVGSATFRSRAKSTERSVTEQQLEGEPVRGEVDALQVCKVLRSALDAEGVIVSKFRLPGGPEQGVDAIADSLDGRVRVQVVGVLPRHQLAELARTGSATSSRTPDERADDVCAALKKKVESYPGSVRKDVILAVDSIRSFEHVQPAVLECLARSPHNAILASSGFKSVWLVGPYVQYAYRLV